MIPQIDARLDADFDMALCQRFQQFDAWEKNLIDEIDIFNALREQRVDLVKNNRQRPLAIAVAEIVFGAKGPMLGAPA